MTKIFHYSPRFYPLLGGIETHVDSIVKDMPHRDFEIISKKILQTTEYEKYLKNCDIRRFGPLEFESASKVPWKLKLLHSSVCEVIRGQRVKKYLSDQHYGLLHVHEVDTWNLVRLDILLKKNDFAKLSESIIRSHIQNKTSLLTKHSLFTDEYNLPYLKKYVDFERRLISSFENIICVDKHIFEYIQSRWSDKNVYFIPNFVDTDNFKFAPDPGKDYLNVGFVGRVDRIKGIGLIKELISKIPPYVKLHLVLSGNESELDGFIDISSSHKSQILIYRNISNTELPKIMEKIDVFLNPIIIPGISRTTLEAMSSGKPVIMTNVGDRYPVLNGINGILINNNIDEILEVLYELHNDRKKVRLMGKNARKLIESEFSKERILSQIDAVYSSLLT